MIKTWDDAVVGDSVLFLCKDKIHQGTIVEVKKFLSNENYRIVIKWNIHDNYHPVYEYTKNTIVYNGTNYQSLMFFYTDPQEELVGRLKLSNV